MSIDIFLVESPLQCLNAAEAAFKLSRQSRKYIFVRLNDVESNNEQIRIVLSKFEWDLIVYEEIHNTTSIVKLINFLNFSRKIYQIVGKEKINQVFFGDFRSYWMDSVRRVFCNAEQYLIDDGDITLSIVENYLKKGRSSYFSGWVISLNFCISLSSYNGIKMPKLFTSFKVIGNLEVVENKFDYLKSKINHTEKFSENLIYYFGSRYSEEGILPFTTEIEMLKASMNYLNKFHKNVVYVPHRGDSKEKIDLISTFMEVKPFGMPAEIFLATTEQGVNSIAGCCTSALNNLHSIFDFKEVISFKLPLDDIDQKYKDDFRLTYESYEQLGFRIIDLNDL